MGQLFGKSPAPVKATESQGLVRLALQGLPGSGISTLAVQIREQKDLTGAKADSFGMDFIPMKYPDDEKATMIFTANGGRERFSIPANQQRLHRFASGVILVVDSTAKEKIGTPATSKAWKNVHGELVILLTSPRLIDIPILILANKQDSPDALSVKEISEQLELEKITGREWHLQGCSGLKGDGVKEGLQWLTARAKPRVALPIDSPTAPVTSSAVSGDSTI